MRVLLLGERAVVQEGVDPVTSVRTVSVIAFLAAHAGVPQPRAALAAALWPDTTMAQALTNLRRELHHLRRQLAGNAALEVTSTHLTWHDDPGCQVDLIELRGADVELLAAAEERPQGWETVVARQSGAMLDLYRGELLPGVDETWAGDLREQVEREVVDACDLIVALAGAATPGSLVEETALRAARRRVRLRPLEESGHASLVDLLRRKGDVPGALAAYHRCARVLRQELGVDPGPTTQRLLEELLVTDGAAPPTRTTEGNGLVGRRQELAVLTAELDAAASGGLRVVLVHGEAGSGKSRLVLALLERARARGLRTAVGRGHAMAGSVALAPVLGWLGGDLLRVGNLGQHGEQGRGWGPSGLRAGAGASPRRHRAGGAGPGGRAMGGPGHPGPGLLARPVGDRSPAAPGAHRPVGRP